MSAYHPCLLWPLFLPNLPNYTFILGSAVHICPYWFFKRCFDYARYGCVIWYLITLSYHQGLVLFNHAPSIRDTGFQAKNGVSLHTLFPHFPCVACRVNSLSLRTISTYLLKLFRCQSFVPSIIVQNNHLPKYTWCSTEQFAEISSFNWTIYLLTPLYKGIMHQIPSQWAHECALYRIRRHIGCLSVDNMGRLSVPIFILQH